MNTLRTPAALVVALVVLSAAPVGLAGDADGEEPPCDPYPIGRCGDYQRETVIFCYVVDNGLMVSATDEDALGFIGLGPGETGIPQLDEPLYYLRTTPAEDFVDDPFGAPAPSGVLFKESNFVEGLQPKPFWCGQFVWFAECVPQQWMGPYGVIAKQPDERYL